MRTIFLRYISVAILAVVPVGGRSGLALAQPLDRSGAEALTATVVSADKQAIVVRTDDGSLVTFAIDARSSVPDGLRAGTRVTVRYQALGGDRYQAVRVGIASLPFEAGSTTAAPTPSPEPAEPPSLSSPTPSKEPVPPSGGTTVAGPPGAGRRPGAPPAVPDEVPAAGPLDRTSAPPTTVPSVASPAPSTGDFVTLAAALLVAVGLLGLAFVLERR